MFAECPTLTLPHNDLALLAEALAANSHVKSAYFSDGAIGPALASMVASVLFSAHSTIEVRLRRSNSITSFYGSSCANNGKDALNTPE
eukprot:4851398-Pyramimonas_sp.AAC.1